MAHVKALDEKRLWCPQGFEKSVLLESKGPRKEESKMGERPRSCQLNQNFVDHGR